MSFLSTMMNRCVLFIALMVAASSGITQAGRPTQADIEDILTKDSVLNVALQKPENVKKLENMMKYPWTVRKYIKDPEAGPLLRRFVTDYKLKAAGKPFGDQVAMPHPATAGAAAETQQSATVRTTSAEQQTPPPVAYPALDKRFLRGQLDTPVMGNLVNPVHLSIGLIVFGLIGGLVPLLCIAQKRRSKRKSLRAGNDTADKLLTIGSS